MNLGVVTREGELVVPPFERSLAGCTVKRVMELVEEVIALALPVLVVHFILKRCVMHACMPLSCHWCWARSDETTIHKHHLSHDSSQSLIRLLYLTAERQHRTLHACVLPVLE